MREYILQKLAPESNPTAASLHPAQRTLRRTAGGRVAGKRGPVLWLSPWILTEMPSDLLRTFTGNGMA